MELAFCKLEMLANYNGAKALVYTDSLEFDYSYCIYYILLCVSSVHSKLEMLANYNGAKALVYIDSLELIIIIVSIIYYYM